MHNKYHLFFRSSSHSLVEAANLIEGFLNDDKPTLVTGDFNVCFRQNPNNSISRSLIDQGFSQLVTKPTHVMGGLIDHAYWKDDSESWQLPKIETYSPYYSDHDAVLVTLNRK